MAEQRLGKYRLLAPIAQGGMAEIFLASHEGPGGFEKEVVVKRVHAHMAHDPQFIAMFFDEARLAARLSHPNIVQVTDFGEVDDTYFLCMERLEGADLATILRACNKDGVLLPRPVVAVIASAVCDGLFYAHSLTDKEGRPLGIVHRDLSPSNIFVTNQGAVKLLDFGIAKARDRKAQTEAGQLKGKVAYMSPEQARGLVVDARSDLFALGSVLYEMLTGVRPFHRQNLVASLAAVVSCQIEPPRRFSPDLPEELNAVVLRALQARREDRFQTADEMRRALDAYLATCSSMSPAARLQEFMLEFNREHAGARRGSSGEHSPAATPSPRPTRELEPSLPGQSEPGASLSQVSEERSLVPARPVVPPEDPSVPRPRPGDAAVSKPRPVAAVRDAAVSRPRPTVALEDGPSSTASPELPPEAPTVTDAQPMLKRRPDLQAVDGGAARGSAGTALPASRRRSDVPVEDGPTVRQGVEFPTELPTVSAAQTDPRRRSDVPVGDGPTVRQGVELPTELPTLSAAQTDPMRRAEELIGDGRTVRQGVELSTELPAVTASDADPASFPEDDEGPTVPRRPDLRPARVTITASQAVRVYRLRWQWMLAGAALLCGLVALLFIVFPPGAGHARSPEENGSPQALEPKPPEPSPAMPSGAPVEPPARSSTLRESAAAATALPLPDPASALDRVKAPASSPRAPEGGRFSAPAASSTSAARTEGLLDVNCVPHWCQIYVDDRDTGRYSPALGLKLRSGQHRVKVINPDLHLQQERTVKIVSEQSAKVIFDL